jgi:GT2 family glycosyltransferase
MELDLIVPTYNRQTSLERTLISILNMPVPTRHSISITVADNNSTDATRETVERIAPLFGGRLQYVIADHGQGSSFARNEAILATESELLGFVDDDEELDMRWAEVVFAAFEDPDLDYAGGPYSPVWEAPPPAWINHPNTRTGLGCADYGTEIRAYEDPKFDAQILTGNFVVRRRCLDKVGLFAEKLGRVGDRLLGGEDVEMNERLKKAGFHGLYLPGLIVYHHIPAARLTRSYMRKWAFWTSVSFARIVLQNPVGVQWLGLPRWMYGQLLRAPFRWLKALILGDTAEVFNHELTMWRFSGVFYGVYFFRG